MHRFVEGTDRSAVRGRVGVVADEPQLAVRLEMVESLDHLEPRPQRVLHDDQGARGGVRCGEGYEPIAIGERRQHAVALDGDRERADAAPRQDARHRDRQPELASLRHA